MNMRYIFVILDFSIMRMTSYDLVPEWISLVTVGPMIWPMYFIETILQYMLMNRVFIEFPRNRVACEAM